MPTLNYQGPQKRVRTYEDDQARRQWLVPVIMLGVSAAICMAAGMIKGGIGGAAAVGILYLVMAVVEAALAVGCAYLVSRFGIGFGELWMGILKLGAIVVFAGTMTLFVTGCASIFVYFGLVVALVMGMMDLDKGEAMIFAVVLFAVRIGFYLFLAAAIRGALG